MQTQVIWKGIVMWTTPPGILGQIWPKLAALQGSLGQIWPKLAALQWEQGCLGQIWPKLAAVKAVWSKFGPNWFYSFFSIKFRFPVNFTIKTGTERNSPKTTGNRNGTERNGIPVGSYTVYCSTYSPYYISCARVLFGTLEFSSTSLVV